MNPILINRQLDAEIIELIAAIPSSTAAEVDRKIELLKTHLEANKKNINPKIKSSLSKLENTLKENHEQNNLRAINISIRKRLLAQ